MTGDLLNQRQIEWLEAQGVSRAAWAGFHDLEPAPWAISCQTVVFDTVGYVPNPVGDPAMILPIVLDGSITDFVAWRAATGEIGTLYGEGAMLGEWRVGLDGAGTHQSALRVHRTPLGWLKADRRGICVVDPSAAAHRLSGVVLQPEDHAHAQALAEQLCVPRPVILSQDNQEPTANAAEVAA